MKKLHVVLPILAGLSITATVVAAQNGGIGRTVDAISSALFGGEGTSVSNVSARSGVESQSAEDFRWSGPLSAGESVEIKGINGEITVGLATGSEVVVTAETSARRSDPSTVRIEMVEHGAGLTFCAVYPSRDGERENVCGPRDEGRMSTNNNDVNVHFQVEVPAGVDFFGRTVNGDVEIEGLASDVEAETVNGDIDISTTGFAQAETVNGSIDAVMGAADLEEGVSFSTVNGSISLDLHDDVDADLDASWLNGDFESDLPFALQGRISRRSAQGTLGSGGPELELNTVNGSIRIR